MLGHPLPPSVSPGFPLAQTEQDIMSRHGRGVSFPREESVHPAYARKRRCGYWDFEKCCGLGVGVSPGYSYSHSSDHTKLGWASGGVDVGSGAGRKGETGGKGTNIVTGYQVLSLPYLFRGGINSQVL